MRRHVLLLSLLLLGASAPGPMTPADAETVNCTPILSLPFTIAEPGSYCLTGNLASALASGPAISIEASDVTLDLNGFTIDNSAAGDSTKAWGIAAWSQENLTIVNGRLRGFAVGIQLAQPVPTTTRNEGYRVEGMLVERGTHSGIVVIGARAPIVRDNVIVDLVAPGATCVDGVEGIRIDSGDGARISNNTIANIAPVAPCVGNGIRVIASEQVLLEGNKISNRRPASSTSGVYIDGYSHDVVVVGNRISGMGYGIRWLSGTGKYRENITASCNTPYLGGTNAGNNF